MTPAETDVFPRLTAEQIGRLGAFGHEREVADGETLWEYGAARVPCFAVLAGQVAVHTRIEEAPVAIHEAGEFTGDIDLLSARRMVVLGVARGETRVLQIEPDRLHALVQTDAELGEIFVRAFILRRVTLIAQGRGDVLLIGSRFCGATLPLVEFLTRNARPHRFVDVDHDSAAHTMLGAFHLGPSDVPAVICGGRVLRRPSIAELAECMGMSVLSARPLRDLVVVGAGPAGLAAAVYAASEGLDVLVVEAYAPGGQAGSSSRIENYLGFPSGISGQELAGRAFVQAEKFGAEMAIARTAVRLRCADPVFEVDLGTAKVRARALVIATGAEYRRPTIPDLRRFEGVSVYYGATPMEASMCAGEEVIVVGGGNSAGQAAVFLSSQVKRVHMLVRGSGLKDTMSQYLVRRIETTANITLRTHTEIAEVAGSSALEKVTCVSRSGERFELAVHHVFLMTGARPNTAWLGDAIALDDVGFIKTGPDLSEDELLGWPLERPPYLFETSVPRVFAVGDVRANSIKRVASAVGEGSVCVSLVHKALAE